MMYAPVWAVSSAASPSEPPEPSASSTSATMRGSMRSPSLATAWYTLAICRVVQLMPWPIGRSTKVPPDHCSNGGRSPADSFGSSTPVGAPRPKAERYSANFSSPSRSASMRVPTLEDLPKTPVVVYGRTPWSQASPTVTPAMSMVPGTCSTSSGVVNPSLIVAAAVMILATDPGS